MQIDFNKARGQPAEQRGQPLFVEVARPRRSKHRVGDSQSGPARGPPQQGGPWCGDDAEAASRRRIDGGDYSGWLERHTQRAHAVAPADDDGRLRNRGVKMKMPMRVDMIERQPGRAVKFELGSDLLRYLLPRPAIQCDLNPEASKVAAQSAARIEKPADLRSVAGRIAVGQHQMKPDAKAGQAPRPRHRIGGSRSGDHQTCGAEYAFAVGKLDGGVDLVTEPEIIGRYDQMVQCVSSRRWRRNAKNSTPSRSRRTIISGLRTISDTIAAIFGARR